ncbi:MAG: ribosome recycling factor [Thermodesulfobacteriota bacterium]|nr:ribosome recycling factor [Thermodesulfobacteriota bacterium]
MLELVYEEIEEKMGKTLEVFKNDLKKVRTGRASLALLDGIVVDYYGIPTPLNQLASLSVPESRLIVIQPWDATAIKDVEKAILQANIDLTPSNDGKVIRLSIPPLTEDRRKEIAKRVNQMAEEHKVAMRNIRRDANETLKQMKKDGDISEDESFAGKDKVQKITDGYIEQIDEVFKAKEKEILEL